MTAIIVRDRGASKAAAPLKADWSRALRFDCPRARGRSPATASSGDVMAMQRERGHERRDVGVERELAVLDELHDRDAGERQHGSDDVVQRLVLRGNVERELGGAVPLMEQDPAVARDEHRCADYLRTVDDLLHDGVEVGCGSLRAGRCGGKRRRERNDDRRECAAERSH